MPYKGCLLNQLIRPPFFIDFSALLPLSPRRLDEFVSPDLYTILQSENSREKYTINSADLLYIVSEGNYVEVISQNDKKLLIRNSLHRTAEQFKHLPFLFRCHRAPIDITDSFAFHTKILHSIPFLFDSMKKKCIFRLRTDTLTI